MPVQCQRELASPRPLLWAKHVAVTVTARGLSLVSLRQPYNVDAAIIPSPDGKGRLTSLQKVTVAADGGQDLHLGPLAPGLPRASLQGWIPLCSCGLRGIYGLRSVFCR